LFEGTPEDLLKVKGSFTAQFLKAELPITEKKKARKSAASH
jgi:excinuclease UvrABC ATPase subunit